MAAAAATKRYSSKEKLQTACGSDRVPNEVPKTNQKMGPLPGNAHNAEHHTLRKTLGPGPGESEKRDCIVELPPEELNGVNSSFTGLARVSEDGPW